MKKAIQLSFLLALMGSMSGCATSYWIDRGRDAADVVTATVGIGAGAKVRAGPLNAGLFWNQDRAGVRGGEGITGPWNSVEFTTPLPIFHGPLEPNPWGMHSIELFSPTDEPSKRGKDFWMTGFYVPFVMNRPWGWTPTYFTQIEIAVGALGTIRLGFNPGELLDFVLGWTTLDIFKDDLESRNMKVAAVRSQ